MRQDLRRLMLKKYQFNETFRRYIIIIIIIIIIMHIIRSD